MSVSFKDAFATKRRKLDREKTAARIERELAQIRVMLTAGRSAPGRSLRPRA